MPTADATLLPPPFSSSFSAEERGSARSLDAVGVGTVLGAMIEQKRRASQPSFPSAVVPASPPTDPAPVLELSNDELTDTDEHEAAAEQRAPVSEVFLKAR